MNSSPEIVVEVANLHEGSLGVAKSFVDIIGDAGVKTVKFQMHIAEEEGVRNEPFRIKFSDQDQTRQDYWRRVSLSLDSWLSLKSHCDNLNIEFLCTPFSIKAASLLHENRLVKRWKIASGQATDWTLIEYVAETRLPLIISTGLISDNELHLLKSKLQKLDAWERTTLLHCVSKYPAPLENLNMNLFHSLKQLGTSVGYSDHSGSIYPALYALAHGASMIEVHFTPHKRYFGPDVSSSLLASEIKFLVDAASAFGTLRQSSSTREEYLLSVSDTKRLFRKGIYWADSFEVGHTITKDSFLFLKPVAEFDAVNYEELVGRKVSKNVQKANEVRSTDFN